MTILYISAMVTIFIMLVSIFHGRPADNLPVGIVVGVLLTAFLGLGGMLLSGALMTP